MLPHRQNLHHTTIPKKHSSLQICPLQTTAPILKKHKLCHIHSRNHTDYAHLDLIMDNTINTHTNQPFSPKYMFSWLMLPIPVFHVFRYPHYWSCFCFSGFDSRALSDLLCLTLVSLWSTALVHILDLFASFIIKHSNMQLPPGGPIHCVYSDSNFDLLHKIS